MSHRITRLIAVARITPFIVGLALPSFVLAQEVMKIADALEQTKIDAQFMIEGEVVGTQDQFIYYVEDDTGRMPVYIKEFMVREHGEIKQGDRLRLWGTLREKRLDHDVHGMMVSNLHRLSDQVGASGANNPGAGASTDVVPIDRSALPAAPSIDQGDVIKPAASEDFKKRARAALQAYRQAEEDAVSAGEAYARAARESGSNGQVEAEALERLQAAEARVVETRGAIPALVEEGRQAGIDEGLLKMIQHEAGMR